MKTKILRVKGTKTFMIKGVNRRIVEITGMENDYFEKAVLYIRPDKSAAAEPRIELEARSAVGKLIPKNEYAAPPIPKRHILADITVRLLSVSLIMLSIALMMYLFME